MANITFHARKTTGPQANTHTTLELWKDMHVLGAWQLTNKDAKELAMGLARYSLRPGESIVPLFDSAQ